MRININAEVLNLRPTKTPVYSRYFDGIHDDVECKHRYKSLAQQNEVYLLLPDYERVVIKGFLTEPVSIVKADSRLDEPVVFTSSVHFLVKPHVRKDGLFELRRMEVEGSYLPSS